MLRGLKFFVLTLCVVSLYVLVRIDLDKIRTQANSTNFIVTQMAEITRIEKEMLQFRVNAAAIVRGDPAITRDAYLLSFDLLWARANTDRTLFAHAPVESFLAFRKDVLQLSEGLRSIDPLVQSLQAGDTASLARIERVMNESAPAMNVMNDHAYRELYDHSINAALRQREIVRGLDKVQWIFLMTGFSVLVLLLYQLRRGEKLYAVLRDREAEIRTLAAVDPLTGLSNRRHFDERMKAIDGGTWTGNLHMVLVDLDGFKQINDSMGHDAGDHVLSVVARRLPGAAGHGALIARLGGDEFAIVISGDVAAAKHIAATVIGEISRPVVYNDVVLRVGASAGISSLKPIPAASTALLRESDAALYDAKANGRGQFRHFSETLHSQSAA